MNWSTRSLVVSALVLFGVTGIARGAIVYDSTTANTGLWDFNSFGPAFMLDDAAFTSGVNGGTLTGVSFGYVNHDTAAHSVDAIVTVYSNVNTAAGDTDVVNSNALVSTRFALGSIPAAANSSTPAMGVTGPLTLSGPAIVPNHAFSVEVAFYDTGTNNRSQAVDALLVTSYPPTVGSTVDGYWSDDSDSFGTNDNVFHGGVNGFVSPPGGSHDNLYLQLTGSVPEPTGLLSLAAGAGLLFKRRRRGA